MFFFGNGKSQVSSSEAVNCYYGALLWSLVKHGKGENPSTDDSSPTDFARLLMLMEIRGARTYWHMIPPSAFTEKTAIVSVYSPEFSENYMVET
jgi:endoglucanase Acf2